MKGGLLLLLLGLTVLAFVKNQVTALSLADVAIGFVAGWAVTELVAQCAEEEE